MKISKNTISTLKVLSQINEELVFDEVGYIKIKNNNVIAFKKIEEEFPEFAVNNLHSFLAIINLFDDFDIELHSTHCIIRDNATKTTIRYKFSEIGSIKDQLSKPATYYEDIKDFTGSFKLSKKVLSDLKTASNMMKIGDIKIKVADGEGKLTLTSEMQSNSNTYEVELDEVDGEIDSVLKMDNLLVYHCDYDVYSVNGNFFKFVPIETDSPVYLIGVKR